MQRTINTLVRAAQLALLACVWSAQASGLGVYPIRVDLSVAAPTAAITLTNNGSTTMVLQLQTTQWSNAANEDQYQRSDDLLVTPPIFSIAPGASQVVRVGLGAGADARRELPYRLFVEEVPPPAKPDYQGLRVALRIGIPVFVEPLQAAKPQLQWAAVRVASDTVEIQATNTGNAHGRVLGIQLHPGDEPGVLATQVGASYLLPGQTRVWTLHLDRAWPSERLRLSATTEEGAAHADLVLQRR